MAKRSAQARTQLPNLIYGHFEPATGPWMIAGLDIDEAGCSIRVAVVGLNGPRQYSISIPIAADRETGALSIGTAQVHP